MECISELKDSLNVYFGWNKARMACFVNMLLVLLATRTVNLNKLACVVFGDALQSSRYRRIQRFFSKFPLDYQQIAGFIFKLFFVSDGQWYLSMDRTNWRWGKSDINILMLGNEQRCLKGKRFVWGHLVYLAGLRLVDGELLIVATTELPETAITTYGLRWEIECLFGCFKGRGFNFEDTHITDKARIKKLVALLAIAFTWAHRTGEWQTCC